MSPTGRREGVELFHGSPRDPVWDYVLSFEAVEAAFALTQEPLVLVGHSHVPLAIASEDGALAGGLAPDGTEVELGTAAAWLLNPGSVGQPRDGDPRAAWLLLDFGTARRRFGASTTRSSGRRTRSESGACPDSLAERLARGV